MGGDHYFILLKNQLGYTWKAKHGTDSKPKFKTVHVVRGSLLRLRHKEKHKQQHSSVACITQDGVYVDCSKNQMKELQDYTAQLLLAVPASVKRYKVFSDLTGWLGEGVSLQVGDVVDLNLPWVSPRAYGKIRHKGTVEGWHGIVFGVELAQEFWGRGTSDGSVYGRLYFACEKDSAVFVPVSHLRRTLDQTKFRDVPYTPRNITMYKHMTYQNNNSETLSIGERVVWVSGTGIHSGIVKWLGYLCNADIYEQKVTVGIELDLPVGSGNGYYKGQKLFHSRNGHAEFVPLMDLVKEEDYEGISKATNSAYEEHANVLSDPMDLSFENGFNTVFTEHNCGQITRITNYGYEEYTTIFGDRYRQNTILAEKEYKHNYKIPRYEYAQSRGVCDGYGQFTNYAQSRGACDGYGQMTDYAQSREGYDGFGQMTDYVQSREGYYGYGQMTAVDGDNDEQNSIRAFDEHEPNDQVSVYMNGYGHKRKLYKYEHQNAPVYAIGFDYMNEDSSEVYEYDQITKVGADGSEQNTNERNDESEMLNRTLVIDGCDQNTNLSRDNNEQLAQANRDDFEQNPEKVEDECGPHVCELGHGYDQNKTIVPDDREHHITDPGDECQQQPIVVGENFEHGANVNGDECKQNTQADTDGNEPNTKQGAAENKQITQEVGDTDKETIKESDKQVTQEVGDTDKETIKESDKQVTQEVRDTDKETIKESDKQITKEVGDTDKETVKESDKQVTQEIRDIDKETIEESGDEYAQHAKLMDQRHEQSEEMIVGDEHEQNHSLLVDKYENNAKQLDDEQSTKTVQREVEKNTKQIGDDEEALEECKQCSKKDLDKSTEVAENEIGQHINQVDNPQENTKIAEEECHENQQGTLVDSNMTTSSSSTVDQSKTCDLCSTGQLEVFCTVCMHSMCQPCKQQHDQMPEFSKHDATPLCSHHGKPVTFLCHQCFQGVCMPCMMKEHKDHSESFKPFTEGVELLWMKRKEQNFMLEEKIDTMKRDVEQELVYIGRVKEELKTERFELLEKVFKLDNALADIEEKHEEGCDKMKKKLESIQRKAEALRKPISTVVEAMQFVARYSQEENQIKDLFQSCVEIATKKEN